MLVFFEGYEYPPELIARYFTEAEQKLHCFEFQIGKSGKGLCASRVGYFYVSCEKYSGPIFFLPKLFLQEDKLNKDKQLTLLGRKEIYPETIVDTDSDEDPLKLQGYDTFLPELSLWLFRAMSRYIEDCKKDPTEDLLADLQYTTPDNASADHDFLSAAIRLIDFLSDHRNIFTQIHLTNTSGRSQPDWRRTLRTNPFIKDGKPFYSQLLVKDNALNISEELIILYYSVLNYLKETFNFPIDLGDELPYELKPASEIQRYLDTGIGRSKMRDMKGNYHRDDLVLLWHLLDAFFDNNSNRDDKEPIKEYLYVTKFDSVFEKMVDHLIGDTDTLSALKKQKDGKLVDHIYMDRSLVDKQHNIYFIGDSKYYLDESRPEGVPLYKQYTYARNAIQFNIDEYHLAHKNNPNSIRYRDEETDGYNITPNFFIRPSLEDDKLDFGTPSLVPTDWEPKPNKHYENRLFDRDTLLLKEFSINLIFLIAAYGAYEDHWTDGLRSTIRKEMV